MTLNSNQVLILDMLSVVVLEKYFLIQFQKFLYILKFGNFLFDKIKLQMSLYLFRLCLFCHQLLVPKMSGVNENAQLRCFESVRRF